MLSSKVNIAETAICGQTVLVINFYIFKIGIKLNEKFY